MDEQPQFRSRDEAEAWAYVKPMMARVNALRAQAEALEQECDHIAETWGWEGW